MDMDYFETLLHMGTPGIVIDKLALNMAWPNRPPQIAKEEIIAHDYEVYQYNYVVGNLKQDVFVSMLPSMIIQVMKMTMHMKIKETRTNPNSNQGSQ